MSRLLSFLHCKINLWAWTSPFWHTGSSPSFSSLPTPCNPLRARPTYCHCLLDTCFPLCTPSPMHRRKSDVLEHCTGIVAHAPLHTRYTGTCISNACLNTLLSVSCSCTNCDTEQNRMLSECPCSHAPSGTLCNDQHNRKRLKCFSLPSRNDVCLTATVHQHGIQAHPSSRAHSSTLRGGQHSRDRLRARAIQMAVSPPRPYRSHARRQATRCECGWCCRTHDT